MAPSTKASSRSATIIPKNPRHANRILIQNMPKEVNHPAVKKLLEERVGPVEKVVSQYGPDGKGIGTFIVTFEKHGHANKAVRHLHDAPIDGGKVRLRVAVLFEPFTVAKPPALDKRIGQPPNLLQVVALPSLGKPTAVKKLSSTGKRAKFRRSNAAATSSKRSAAKQSAASKKDVDAVAALFM